MQSLFSKGATDVLGMPLPRTLNNFGKGSSIAMTFKETSLTEAQGEDTEEIHKTSRKDEWLWIKG